MKFAIILSGSGVFDGSEIHEATLSMYSICKNGCEYDIFAPNINQHHVINHITGAEMNEKRNVLVESARIARGEIQDIANFSSDNYDALLMPGGFGVAKNLSDFAFRGSKCIVNKEISSCIINMHKAKKPIGALCISPVILANILKGIEVTIGNDKNTLEEIKTMNGKHKPCSAQEVCVDKTNNIYTTACYMLNSNIYEIGMGIENLIQQIIIDTEKN